MPTCSDNTYLLGEFSKISPIMDVLTFDGRLNYSGYLSNPQFFWIGYKAWICTPIGTHFLKLRKLGLLS